jgi:uncharacterized radical SAM superfamily Fe-S cluster-containing enzyme
MLGAVAGALLGAKLLAWAESLPLIIQRWDDWRMLQGGKTIVGAVLGGWMGVEFVKRRLGLSHPSGDIYVFPLILGMCIGRVGCFLTGLEDGTFGVATTLPWGVDFGDGIHRHPTQLYEIAWLVGAAGVFLWRRATGRQRGCMFSQFLFSYLAFRFGAEFIKPRFTAPYLHLSAIQIACVIGMVSTFRHWNDQCCGGGRKLQPPEPADAAAPRLVELTMSLCPECLAKVEAKVIIEGGRVFLQKFCPQHGRQRVLIADDAAYWEQSRALYKPPTSPLRRNTEQRRGCPHDCGLCPDHEQHSCLAIVEITEQCDLGCPICYAACTAAGKHRSLAQVESMIDSAVANEGRLSVLQISGGEPALHPELFDILDAARRRPIGHLMLNTNGRRLAREPEFAARLATYMPRFEVYLQFDSLRPESLKSLRGLDLTETRQRALEALERHNISTTLVVTLKRGVNDGEAGEIIDHALKHKCVRGVTFQPIQAAGRLNGFDALSHRLTLSEVRRAILAQHKLFTAADLVPVPCHADALAMAYAIRRGGKAIPLSRLVDPRSLLNLGGNTICYEQDPVLRQHALHLFSTGASPTSAAADIQQLCCNPELPLGLRYGQVFRIIIMQFMDAHSMDLRSLKRSCVHIVHPDGRLIPFDTYNLFYRGAAANAEPDEAMIACAAE